MKFTRIKVTDKVVELDWTITTSAGDKDTITRASVSRPMPALLQALAAFREFVADLLDLPAWGDEIRITSSPRCAQSRKRQGGCSRFGSTSCPGTATTCGRFPPMAYGSARRRSPSSRWRKA